MNKDYILGFFCCLFLFFLIAATSQIGIKKDKEVNDEIQNIYRDLQQKQFKIYTSTPNAIQLRTGEVVLYSSGTIILRLYTKINGIMWSLKFSTTTT